MSPDPNEEIHQRTIEALQHAKEGKLTDDDLSILCMHCGIDSKDIHGHQDHEVL